MGGRLTLCKTVLGGLGVYLFSLFKAPTGVLKDLEKKRSHFFWGNSNNTQKIVWIAWEKVVIAREKGGIGIGSLRAHNIALLAKWWWRFKTETNSIWKTVIVSIHGEFGKIGEDLRNLQRKGTWGKIVELQKDLNSSNIHLNSQFSRHFEKGKNIRFWTERWDGVSTLETKFPRIAALDVNRNCYIADRISESDNGVKFCGHWKRPIRGGREEYEVKELEKICRTFPIWDEGEGWNGGFRQMESSTRLRCVWLSTT